MLACDYWSEYRSYARGIWISNHWIVTPVWAVPTIGIVFQHVMNSQINVTKKRLCGVRRSLYCLLALTSILTCTCQVRWHSYRLGPQTTSQWNPWTRSEILNFSRHDEVSFPWRQSSEGLRENLMSVNICGTSRLQARFQVKRSVSLILVNFSLSNDFMSID